MLCTNALSEYRRRLILEAKHSDDLDEVIDDLSHVKIAPLLQAVLAQPKTEPNVA